MTTYRVSSFSTGLLADIKTPEQIADEVAGMHETMRSEGERLLRARDQAARMMSGTEDFGALWALPVGGFDPQQIDLHADRVVGACGHVSAMAPYPGGTMTRDELGDILLQIARIDREHPLVAQRDLLRAACTGMDQSAPAWEALEAELA